MTCVEEWKAKLRELGLSPLPEHLVSFVEAMCDGAPAAEAAAFLFRMYSWPKRLLELSHIYVISDKEFKELQGLFLAHGESDAFATAINALRRKDSPLASSLATQDVLDGINDLNQKRRREREAEFKAIVSEELARHGSDMDPQVLAPLKQHFISRSMSEANLRGAIADAIAIARSPKR